MNIEKAYNMKNTTMTPIVTFFSLSNLKYKVIYDEKRCMGA